MGALDVTLVDAEGLLTSEAADDDLDADELENDELDEIDDELDSTAVEVRSGDRRAQCLNRRWSSGGRRRVDSREPRYR